MSRLNIKLFVYSLDTTNPAICEMAQIFLFNWWHFLLIFLQYHIFSFVVNTLIIHLKTLFYLYKIVFLNELMFLFFLFLLPHLSACKCVYNFIDITIHYSVNVRPRLANTVICNSVLWEIISTDFFNSVTCSYLILSITWIFFILSSSSFRSWSFEVNICIAFSLLANCFLSVVQRTSIPVGVWISLTAVSTLLTFCPPAPLLIENILFLCLLGLLQCLSFLWLAK